MSTIASLEVTALRLDGDHREVRQLEDALVHLRSQARKKHVATVDATLRFSDTLVLRVEVQERGARLRVAGRGLYACSVDGVHRALADVIREEHGSDSAMLDVYQRVIATG